MDIGDVGPFHRFARFYDLGMPSADPAVLRRGLDRATRDVERLLDVGGGTGRAAMAVDAPNRVVVDAATGMLRQAKGKGLVPVRADGAHLPFGDDTVDAVLIVDALHHFRDRSGAIREARRVLRPGGVLVVREFDPGTLRGRALVAVEHLVGLDSSFSGPDDLAVDVAAAGLDPAVVDRGFGYTVVGRYTASANPTGTAKW